MRSRIQEMERHQLSDGGWARVTKLGRSYTFTRAYPSFDTPPDVYLGLKKVQAYKMLEQTIRADVLEIDG